MNKIILMSLILSLGLAARAEIQSRALDYADGETILEGEFFFDDAADGARPGVIVFHQWAGPTDHERDFARRLVEAGYVAFVADVYGKGVRPESVEDKGAQATRYKSDRLLTRFRAKSALRTIREQSETDGSRVAAIGFCFGGTVSLELARSGADVLGVVSFHGGLEPGEPADASGVKAKVLALHGADDPWVPEDEVAAFEKEMRELGADWQLVKYGGAVHAFTQKEAGSDPSTGAAYNASVAARSWHAMADFLDEVLR